VLNNQTSNPCKFLPCTDIHYLTLSVPISLSILFCDSIIASRRRKIGLQCITESMRQNISLIERRINHQWHKPPLDAHHQRGINDDSLKQQLRRRTLINNLDNGINYLRYIDARFSINFLTASIDSESRDVSLYYRKLAVTLRIFSNDWIQRIKSE